MNDTGFKVDTVVDLQCRYRPVPWRFAIERGADIDRHWAEAVRERPQLFNGRVLMLTAGGIVAGPRGPVFQSDHTDVDFKAFLAWRDWGYPARGLRNAFGMAALRSSDGAFVLGEMGAHTANAGRIYFPSGTPDLGDVRGQDVDLAGSIRRELHEETGLALDTLRFADRFTVIQDDLRVCIMQTVQASSDAEALVSTIAASLAQDTEPELTRMHIVRSAADITAAMPPFVALYLRGALDVDQPG